MNAIDSYRVALQRVEQSIQLRHESMQQQGKDSTRALLAHVNRSLGQIHRYALAKIRAGA